MVGANDLSISRFAVKAIRFTNLVAVSQVSEGNLIISVFGPKNNIISADQLEIFGARHSRPRTFPAPTAPSNSLSHDAPTLDRHYFKGSQENALDQETDDSHDEQRAEHDL
jgi:hypothetical protein